MKVKVIRVTLKPATTEDENINNVVCNDTAVCTNDPTCCKNESSIALDALQIQYDAAKSRICKLEAEINEQKSINARLLEECRDLNTQLIQLKKASRCDTVCHIPYGDRTICAVIRKV